LVEKNAVLYSLLPSKEDEDSSLNNRKIYRRSGIELMDYG
jgi:hypothetical protein